MFALANPDPEVDPAVALQHAAVVATGRSDYPNQINNVLAFPGVFRGLLDAQARDITDAMLLAAAAAIADVVSEPNPSLHRAQRVRRDGRARGGRGGAPAPRGRTWPRSDVGAPPTRARRDRSVREQAPDSGDYAGRVVPVIGVLALQGDVREHVAAL